LEGPGHNVEAGRRMGEGVSFRGFGVAHWVEVNRRNQ